MLTEYVTRTSLVFDLVASFLDLLTAHVPLGLSGREVGANFLDLEPVT